ncbi:unnamed protein product [Brachionus calyciflorus]|uniref:Uncharacterized protein n=1 Tax=Brachionus calyciflorus TaxID=104777 RepID=A0A814EJJ1_9BILA|nr:unnamed protein product [Brachionus calyciflorus]
MQVKNENESLINSNKLKECEILKEIIELKSNNDLDKNLNCVNLKLKQALIDELKTAIDLKKSVLVTQQIQNQELVVEIDKKKKKLCGGKGNANKSKKTHKKGINCPLNPKNIQKDLSFKDDLNSKCLKNKNSDVFPEKQKRSVIKDIVDDGNFSERKRKISRVTLISEIESEDDIIEIDDDKDSTSESDYETDYATRTRRLSHAKKHFKEFKRKEKLKSCDDEDPIVGVYESNCKANGRLLRKGKNEDIELLIAVYQKFEKEIISECSLNDYEWTD